jgi:predicted nucleotidyltransferase
MLLGMLKQVLILYHMRMNSIIEKHLTELVALCRKYKVERIYAFGSVVSGKFDKESSDIDLIVELAPMPPLEKGEKLLSLWNDLENLFKRKVDLLTDKPIQNPYLKKSIEATKQLIYEREGEKISI